MSREKYPLKVLYLILLRRLPSICREFISAKLMKNFIWYALTVLAAL